jgi:hypothetical protein
VRLSVQVSGICGFLRPLCPAGRLWRGGRWAGSRMAGMAGVGVVACPVHGQFVGCPGRNLAVEAGAGLLGQRRVGLDLAVVVGGGWAVARSTTRGWMHARIARWRGLGCAARRRLRWVVIV